jgi:hypothetical protein
MAGDGQQCVCRDRFALHQLIDLTQQVARRGVAGRRVTTVARVRNEEGRHGTID